MAATTTAAKSLEELSTDAVVSNLGKLAKDIECRFSCGGTLPQVHSVTIVYKKQATGEWSAKPLQLPGGLTEESLQDFLDSCSPASFGYGSEAVLDKKYRDALKLEPDSFCASFELTNTSILDNITTVMSIDSPIRAELYKLNVYSKGGHFKTHVDTPRSEDMFGSLVVCLPSDFKGGQLVTRHQGRQTTYDWSSSVQTHWAALFSDVEHEVLPVTAGYRITLTYNLYHLYSSPSADRLGAALLDITTNPLYKELLSALKNPQFMKEGGTLGFYCQHKYTNISTDLEKFHLYLKGEDAIVYKVAKVLQLSVTLRPLLYVVGDFPSEIILQEIVPTYEEDDEFEEMNVDVKERKIPGQYVMDKFVSSHKQGPMVAEDEERLEDLKQNTGTDLERVTGIMWCQGPKVFEPFFSNCVIYGNDPIVYTHYQSAAFLVQIPGFTTQRGSPVN